MARLISTTARPRTIEAATVNAISMIMLLRAIEAIYPSTLTGTDPLLLTGIDPVSARRFVISRRD